MDEYVWIEFTHETFPTDMLQGMQGQWTLSNIVSTDCEESPKMISQTWIRYYGKYNTINRDVPLS